MKYLYNYSVSKAKSEVNTLILEVQLLKATIVILGEKVHGLEAELIKSASRNMYFNRSLDRDVFKEDEKQKEKKKLT